MADHGTDDEARGPANDSSATKDDRSAHRSIHADGATASAATATAATATAAAAAAEDDTTSGKAVDWLSRGMRGLVGAAVLEAAIRGTSTVEAEHVLLAIVSATSSPAAGILAAGGLDHAGLGEALDIERRLSLAAIGAAVPDRDLLRSTPRAAKPSWGASVAAARARAGALPRTRRAAEPVLAAGILAASLGTVPRALAYAGIDRERLLELLDARPND
ncbi:MAG: hypothetical protein JWQ19_2532 [Subtercola sp.]|nr:hypothetical protein [Subtercola sp.]